MPKSRSVPSDRATSRAHAALGFSIRALMIPVLALLVALTAMQAARADDRDAAKKACMNDYKKFCSGIFPGGGRVKKCLTDNLAKLEPPCREIVARNAGAGNASQAK